MSGVLYRPERPVVAAIDIGTTKVCVLVGQKDEQGVLTVLGIGSSPSLGIKKGVILNVAAASATIKRAVHDAEYVAGVRVLSAVVGISGSHIKSFDSVGVISVRHRDVRQQDIDRVVEIAKAIPLEQGREILHVLPQYFRLDGTELIKDSRGMSGMKLEAQVHIITGSVVSAENCIMACEHAGVAVDDIILEQIASATAVLTPAERAAGVGILDIGGGTSDFAVYKDNTIRYSKVFPIGGAHFTSDIALGLGIPLVHAEELKKKHGSLLRDESKLFLPFEYEGGEKEIDCAVMTRILQARAEEIFGFLKDEIDKNRLVASMPAGIVLTGGGALLGGLAEFVAAQCGVAVRVGSPDVPLLAHPSYATAWGLLLRADSHERLYYNAPEEVGEPLMRRVFQRMKSWIAALW